MAALWRRPSRREPREWNVERASVFAASASRVRAHGEVGAGVEERRYAKRWFAAGPMPEKSGRDSGPAGGGHSTVTNTGLE